MDLMGKQNFFSNNKIWFDTTKPKWVLFFDWWIFFSLLNPVILNNVRFSYYQADNLEMHAIKILVSIHCDSQMSVDFDAKLLVSVRKRLISKDVIENDEILNAKELFCISKLVYNCFSAKIGRI